MEKKEHIATWDGNPTTWLEYVKRVRLQYERTEYKKKHLLGAELTSRLTGRAWDVASADVDHGLLQRPDGAAYLLKFLEERLCKAPVPDTGQRLEDFFIRLRRSPGASMTEWSTQLREAYRRLQRAMARQRKDMQVRSEQGKKHLEPSAGSESPLKRLWQDMGQRRQSDVTSPIRRGSPAASQGQQSFHSNPGHHGTGNGDGPRERGDGPNLEEPKKSMRQSQPGILMRKVLEAMDGLLRNGKNGMLPVVRGDGGIGTLLTTPRSTRRIPSSGNSLTMVTCRFFPMRSWDGCFWGDRDCRRVPGYQCWVPSTTSWTWTPWRGPWEIRRKSCFWQKLRGQEGTFLAKGGPFG